MLLLPGVTWMSYSFLQVFLAPTSSEPVILGLLNLHLLSPRDPWCGTRVCGKEESGWGQLPRPPTSASLGSLLTGTAVG